MSFDPYDDWLKISPGSGPPSYYDLLGLAPFEADPERIRDAGMQRMAHVRRFQLGQHGADAIRLLGELALAFDCLSTPERKAAYDANLGASQAWAAPPPPVTSADQTIEGGTGALARRPDQAREASASDEPPPVISRPPAPPRQIDPEKFGVRQASVEAAAPLPASRLPNWAWLAAGAVLGLVVVGFSVLTVLALSTTDSTANSVPAEPTRPTAHLQAPPEQSVIEGQPLSLQVSVDDPTDESNAATGNDSWRYFLQAGAPSGAQIDKNSGVFSWTPDESQGPATYCIAVAAQKPGQPELAGEIQVKVREANQSPQITAIADATIDEERPYSFTFRARDADLPPNRLTFSLEPGAPEGMQLDPKSGRLEWTPSEAQGPGEYLIGVRVSDDFSPPGVDMEKFSITVREVNRPPAFEAVPKSKTVNLYDLATLELKATDPDLPPNKLTFSFEGEPPEGAEIDDVSSTLVWRPAPKFYGTKQKISLRVTDDAPQPLSDQTTLTIDVGRTATNSIGMKLVYIQPGEFRMGFELRPDSNQARAHDVTIEKPFYLGQFEVTTDQFALFVREQNNFQTEAERDGRGGQIFNGYDFDDSPLATWQTPGFPQTGEHPVVDVTWNDAQRFCQWLTNREGRRYRLPTEAEWEYCCRAGTTTNYSSGNNFRSLQGVANIADASFSAMVEKNFPLGEIDPDERAPWNDGFVYTAPVGSFRPNDFELYDMHGNISEWCQDAFGGGRIVRGGSFHSLPEDVRSALRKWHVPSFRRNDLGFRVVADGGDPLAPPPPQ
ncbi:MAG TPA: SUMF1/EgtB/PvdO family nonheme iron enzyme [Pirellulales bacterium]|nr:SUMF1/EgtB/PvdO family nonheme iron enzyme [Pirellulales bacterium]